MVKQTLVLHIPQHFPGYQLWESYLHDVPQRNNYFPFGFTARDVVKTFAVDKEMADLCGVCEKTMLNTDWFHSL